MNKKLVIAGIFISKSLVLLSQQPVYEILKKGTKYSSQEIKETFKHSDFCGLINPTEDYTIKFDDGTEVKIYSAQSSNSIDPECVRPENIMEVDVVWFIKEGNLLKAVNIKSNKKS